MRSLLDGVPFKAEGGKTAFKEFSSNLAGRPLFPFHRHPFNVYSEQGEKANS